MSISTKSSVKTNLNSVSNGSSSSFAELNQHINTCLQRWRQKNLLPKGNKHHCEEEKVEEKRKATAHSNKKYSCHCGLYNSNKFSGISGKESSQKLNSFQSITTARPLNPTAYSDKTGPRKYGRKVEIVAKLLSATLIAKASTQKKSCGQQTDKTACCRFEDHLRTLHSSTSTLTTSSTGNCCSSDAMTVTELTFLEVREEYPDLDSEIRSILTARAQDGATIPEIRDDYRKLTGLPFPIYEDVTEFLLTIPHVTAYCSEKGTRIFNVRSIEKTKHIHDMVMQQKTQPDCVQKSSRENRFYYRERQRNNNYHPYTGRDNANHRILPNSAPISVEPITVNCGDQEKLITITDNHTSQGFSENNCYYQDNCNYLFKRICNQQYPLPARNQILTNTQIEQQITQSSHKTQALPPPLVGSSIDMNNFNTDDDTTYKNNLNHFNNLFCLQQQIEQQPYQLYENNNLQNDIRRSSTKPYKNAMPRSSSSSSPTVNSWYTTDTAFTDSDYEAHLLDFLLLGDDFLLYMARMELKCKFKKNQRILQSGLCVSGQTIRAAIKRIRALNGDTRRSIIVNIGSVDIMQGRQLIQIEHDFRELILTMLKRGITPILTTLAPLANYSHNNDMKSMLERFNEFIKREGQRINLIVIDVWKCLVNERGYVLFDCYQNEPRNVTGTSESYLFWNKIGRQRVLKLIESHLEY